MSANDIKNFKPEKLFWVDLEMTGLNPNSDVILEVAAVITDFDFKELASYKSVLKHDRAEVTKLLGKNPWWEAYPKSRDDILVKLDTGKDPLTVQSELIELVQGQFGESPIILAGNSIHQDRKFIARWWPELDEILHYRMFDVTSLKIYMRGKYDVEYQKNDVHRASDDIEESIAEWKYYMDWLSKSAGKTQ